MEWNVYRETRERKAFGFKAGRNHTHAAVNTIEQSETEQEADRARDKERERGSRREIKKSENIYGLAAKKSTYIRINYKPHIVGKYGKCIACLIKRL